MVLKVLEKIGGVAKNVLGTANERMLREIYPLVQKINSLEPEFQRKPDSELRALTDRFRERLRGPKSFEEKQQILERDTAGGLRQRPGGRPARARNSRAGQPLPHHAALRRAAHRRHRAAPRHDRRDGHRRGQDAGGHLRRLPERPDRRRRAPGDHERLPGPRRLRVDGPGLPLPGPDGRRHRAEPGARREARRLPLRRHLRHQHGVRLRLPARQHALRAGPPGADRPRPQLRHRGRGGQPADRRGPRAPHPQRPRHPAEREVLHGQQRGPLPAGGPRLRGQGEGADLPAHRRGHRPRREDARRGQHLQRRQHGLAALHRDGPSRPPDLQAGHRLHRQGRRGGHRRRVHRPPDGGPRLGRRPAPGRHRQGGPQAQGGDPDGRHHHPPELLPPLHQAGRHDGHGHDGGGRVQQDLRPGGGLHPHQPAADPQGVPGRRLPHRGRQVGGRRRRDRRAAQGGPAGAGRHHQHREQRAPERDAHAQGHRARGAERQAGIRRPRGGHRGQGRPERQR